LDKPRAIYRYAQTYRTIVAADALELERQRTPVLLINPSDAVRLPEFVSLSATQFSPAIVVVPFGLRMPPDAGKGVDVGNGADVATAGRRQPTHLTPPT
jgi:hypothetical protein